ncbi:hypothetical protein GOOTI_098_00300 [Gordonia otitidis NBRC 100426]|uniref:Uncharacterized protein n=2 Tax=Gordonia otitidis TaxID=249058 RepID=H5TL70_GORO1|nr:hypothetical protein GOOTI_098_00300 [Gordonia otitidis NBRC 100426]
MRCMAPDQSNAKAQLGAISGSSGAVGAFPGAVGAFPGAVGGFPGAVGGFLGAVARARHFRESAVSAASPVPMNA